MLRFAETHAAGSPTIYERGELPPPIDDMSVRLVAVSVHSTDVSSRHSRAI